MSESRGGLSQATSAGAVGGEVRAAWRLGMAACNSPRVLQIRPCRQLCPGIDAGRVLTTQDFKTQEGNGREALPNAEGT